MSNRAFKKLKVKEHNEKFERKKQESLARSIMIENDLPARDDVVVTGTKRLTLAYLALATALLNSRPYDNH